MWWRVPGRPILCNYELLRLALDGFHSNQFKKNVSLVGFLKNKFNEISIEDFSSHHLRNKESQTFRRRKRIHNKIHKNQLRTIKSFSLHPGEFAFIESDGGLFKLFKNRTFLEQVKTILHAHALWWEIDFKNGAWSRKSEPSKSTTPRRTVLAQPPPLRDFKKYIFPSFNFLVEGEQERGKIYAKLKVWRTSVKFPKWNLYALNTKLYGKEEFFAVVIFRGKFKFGSKTHERHTLSLFVSTLRKKNMKAEKWISPSASGLLKFQVSREVEQKVNEKLSRRRAAMETESKWQFYEVRVSSRASAGITDKNLQTFTP